MKLIYLTLLLVSCGLKTKDKINFDRHSKINNGNVQGSSLEPLNLQDCDFSPGKISCQFNLSSVQPEDLKDIVLTDENGTLIPAEDVSISVEGEKIVIVFPSKYAVQQMEYDTAVFRPSHEDSVQEITQLSMAINFGALYTNSKTVDLTIEATGATEMYVTDDPSCKDNGTWEPYSLNKSWELTQTNQEIPIYIKFRNNSGAVTDCISSSITHDDQPPSEGFLEINLGAERTKQTNISLQLTASDVADMYITNSIDCESGGVWQPFSTQKNWVLGQTNATGAVYVKFRDEIGNESDCTSDSIIHDGIAPSEGSIVINNDTTFTNDSSVTLTINGEEAFEMYITNEPGCSEGGFWESYTSLKEDHELSTLNSESMVHIKFRDLAGNESACIGDTIIHDNEAPTLPTVNDGIIAPASGMESPEIAWKNASDLVSGISYFEISLGTSPGEANLVEWTAVSENASLKFEGLSLSSGVNYYANVRVTDKAGNVSEVASGDGFIHHFCHTIDIGGAWVPVPENEFYPAGEFCVMKFEAKEGLDGSPVSEAAGSPWQVSQETAISACASLGAGYQLISNTRWMALATDILFVPSNWTGGDVGNGAVIRGHTDSIPNKRCSASDNDADAYFEGVDCTGESSGDSIDQRRTMYLSNGSVIWDLSGNSYELVNLSLSYSNQPKPGEITSYTDLINVAGSDLMSKNDVIPLDAIENYRTSENLASEIWTSENGLGKFKVSPKYYSPAHLKRGGSYKNFSSSGIFNTNFHIRYEEQAGFRCTISVPN